MHVIQKAILTAVMLRSAMEARGLNPEDPVQRDAYIEFLKGKADENRNPRAAYPEFLKGKADEDAEARAAVESAPEPDNRPLGDILRDAIAKGPGPRHVSPTGRLTFPHLSPPRRLSPEDFAAIFGSVPFKPGDLSVTFDIETGPVGDEAAAGHDDPECVKCRADLGETALISTAISSLVALSALVRDDELSDLLDDMVDVLEKYREDHFPKNEEGEDI